MDETKKGPSPHIWLLAGMVLFVFAALSSNSNSTLETGFKPVSFVLVVSAVGCLFKMLMVGVAEDDYRKREATELS